MAPVAASLAQSESKARFFQRLGLHEGDKMHRHLYSLMKAEASQGWARMTANRENLLPHLRQDSTIEPPYTFGMIQEDAMQREILYIFENSRPDTKIMYSLGRDTEGGVEQNWIIRWLIWHVFRYRDERNANISRRGLSQSPRGEDAGDQTLETLADSTDDQSSLQAAASASLSVSQESHDQALLDGSRQEASTSTRRYWDPVREEFRE